MKKVLHSTIKLWHIAVAVIPVIVSIIGFGIKIGAYKAKIETLENKIKEIEQADRQQDKLQFETLSGIQYIDTVLRIKLSPDYEGIPKIEFIK